MSKLVRFAENIKLGTNNEMEQQSMVIASFDGESTTNFSYFLEQEILDNTELQQQSEAVFNDELTQNLIKKSRR